MSASEKSFINQIPVREILLKQVDTKDSVVGGFNTCNLNFKELSTLYTIITGAIKEIADTVNIDELIKNAMSRLHTSKLAITLHYAQQINADSLKVEHNDSVYEVNRIDQTTYVISRMAIGDDITPWNTTNIIAQVKTNDGIVSNATIITRDNSVIVAFQDAPQADHLLLLV